MKRALASIATFAAIAAATVFAHAAPFSYRPAGELLAGSGKGRVDTKVYFPGMRFPIEAAPAYANSQVWGAGGSMGPGGSQCSTSNFSYPWRDNYCESRSWDMPLCPAGIGHQGQDIRAASCTKDIHPTVATADGTITSVGSYSVYLTAADGTRFDYLHMSGVTAKVGDKVKRGQRLGKISNVFGSTPTTVHVHFNIRQTVGGVGTVFVPPYMSLVKGYEEIIGPPPDVNDLPKGQLDSASCDEIRGWAHDPDAGEKPIVVRLYIDGMATDPSAKMFSATAATKREDLCTPLGSCDHGFISGVPLSLRDGKRHEIRGVAIDSGGGPNAELAGGPKTITCAPVVPEGVRRRVPNAAVYASWNFDPLWSEVMLDDAKVMALPAGLDLPSAPELVKADDGSPEVWLLDSGFRRHVPNPDVLVAWEFGGESVNTMTAAELNAMPKGPVVRSAPFLVRGAGPDVYLIDDAFGGTPPSTRADAGTTPEDGSLTAAADGGDVEGSCNCSLPSTRRRTPALAAMAVLAVIVGRRRRRGVAGK